MQHQIKPPNKMIRENTEPFFISRNILSGCRELNPVLTHPKGKYYRCTTPRRLFPFGQGLDAFCAGQNSFSRIQFDPLQIGVFPVLDSRVVFAPELYQAPNHPRTFVADCALFCHMYCILPKILIIASS